MMFSPRRRLSLILAVLFAACLVSPVHAAELSLGGMFTNHAVIQRDKPIAVWGKAAPAGRITVTLDHHSQSTQADADGNWRVNLPAMKAGGPYEITVKSGDKTLTLHDILLGDVWICSGQSNMRFSVNRGNNAPQEIAAAHYPNIRIFRVANHPSLKPVAEVKGQWKQVSPQTIPRFSAVGYFFGRDLYKALNIPIGLIDNSWGGMPAESYTSRATLESDPDFKPIFTRSERALANYDKDLAAYEKKIKKNPSNHRLRKPLGVKSPRNPAALWNGMTEPIFPYAIKGVIWYQGESNANRAYQYRKLFPDMIQDWRKLWGPNTPFLFVQLANFRKAQTNPGERTSWPELREAQAMALRLPHTAMATAIDVGAADTIHPKDKQTVGYRLALDALAIAYGKPVVYQGPTFDAIQIKGDTLRIRFKHTDGGLKIKGNKLTGFVIAGKNRKWYWADATIDGNTVVVKSDQVPHPVAVRYGWASNPPVSLYNGKNLPAPPFRSDDWPDITLHNK